MFSLSHPLLLSTLTTYLTVVASQSTTFDWGKVQGTDDYNWQPCYGTFECSRLNVPLNYTNPDVAKAGIAIIRQKGNDTQEGIPLFFNPGGPGGSGVTTIVALAQALRSRVGPSYDLIGFDPRGIAASTPRGSLFNNQCDRERFYSDGKFRFPGASPNDLALAFARSQLQGQLANISDQANSGYLREISTEATARDILYMAQKFGREKVSYYGLSYGSLLGQTFATMFPDKVERMVIDAILDADDYYGGMFELTTQDTEKAMQIFYDECARAGSERCPFWSSSPESIKAELDALYQTLRTTPNPALLGNSTFEVLDYIKIRSTIVGALNNPWTDWTILAQGLADLSRNKNGTLILAMYQASAGMSGSCSNPALEYAPVTEGHTLVSCNDAKSVHTDSFSEVVKNVERMNSTGPWGGHLVGPYVACVGYPSWPKNHFQGPVGSNTSTPILIISNTADPATPISSGKKARQLFPGSALLTIDQPGHGSLVNTDNCTIQVFQDYWMQGKLPEEEKVCQPDRSNIFGGFGATEGAVERRELGMAMRGWSY